MILKPVTHWSMGYCFPFDHTMKCMSFFSEYFFSVFFYYCHSIENFSIFWTNINRKALHSSVSVLPFIAVVKYRFMVCSLFSIFQVNFHLWWKNPTLVVDEYVHLLFRYYGFFWPYVMFMFLKNILKNNLVRVARFTKFFN